MPRPAPVLLLALALLAPAGGGAGAQGGPVGVVRGQVFVAGTDVSLPYSTVAIADAGVERFVDPQGRFLLRGVPAGPRRLRVRHIGYLPLDTTLVVPADGALPPLRLELRRAPQQLALVQVRGDGPCRAPGPPSPASDAEFAGLFDQLRQNAEQYRLLASAYPFVYTMERAFGFRNPGGYVREDRQRDTILLGATPRWPYEPGRVVVPREDDDGRRGELDARLPGLLDFADSTFQHTHCFAPGGLETLEGRRVVRVNFRADERLSAPDVNGAFFLDAETYRIVAAEFELSRIPERLRSVRRIAARTTYREILPGVPVIARIDATNELKAVGSNRSAAQTERQSLVDVRFLREVPGREPVEPPGAPPPQPR